LYPSFAGETLDEINSNIRNNSDYYFFLIYKCCFDLLSLFGLYFRMVITTQFYLWDNGWPSAQAQYNIAAGLSNEEHSTFNFPFSSTADLISSNLEDSIPHSTFLAEDNEEKNTPSSSTDFNDNFNSSTSDKQDYFPGLGTHKHNSLNERGAEAEEDNNSPTPTGTTTIEETVKEPQPSTQVRGEDNLSSSPTAEPKNYTVPTNANNHKKVTFNPKSEVLDFEHKLEE
jgi:hypothetical protein